jgi:hypothetical protein
VNLAVLNLLPVPVLDGGQLVMLLAEAVIRKPVPVALRERLTMVGLVVVVLLHGAGVLERHPEVVGRLKKGAREPVPVRWKAAGAFAGDRRRRVADMAADPSTPFFTIPLPPCERARGVPPHLNRSPVPFSAPVGYFAELT